MKVFLLKDIPHVGMAGEMVSTSSGHARNYLIPRKLAVEVTSQNESSFKHKIKVVERRKEVVASKTSLLAERIKSLTLILYRKMHDDNRLYGAVNAHEIVELLAEKGIRISKSQVVFDKAIKTKGTYPVTIKLSSQLQPSLTLKVVSEK